jgi:hypothetical protein
MAELTTPTPVSSCCSTDTQARCCEPADKDACCGTAAAGGTCGCSEGKQTTESVMDVRETVRERYAAAALAATEPSGASCGCETVSTTDAAGTEVFGATLYDADETDAVPEGAVGASLGCGVPTAVADLHEGEIPFPEEG